jgi:hypothetical protein
MAKYELNVWRSHGPVVQAVLVDRVKTLEDDEKAALRPLLTKVLAEVLKPEVTGTTSASSSITLHRGSVAASDSLRDIRQAAMVRGEFGLVDLYISRRSAIETWLADPREKVRAFAAGLIRDLDRWIAAEQRSAEGSIAMRRLEYDEDAEGEPGPAG